MQLYNSFRSLLTAVMLILCVSVMADWYAVAHIYDGTVVEIKATDVGSFVAVDDNPYFNVLDADGKTILANVSKVTFAEHDATGIENVRKDTLTQFLIANNSLTIIGSAKTATIYDSKGAEIKEVGSKAGKIDIDISGLPIGAYIVKSGEQTIKFIKK